MLRQVYCVSQDIYDSLWAFIPRGWKWSLFGNKSDGFSHQHVQTQVDCNWKDDDFMSILADARMAANQMYRSKHGLRRGIKQAFHRCSIRLSYVPAEDHPDAKVAQALYDVLGKMEALTQTKAKLSLDFIPPPVQWSPEPTRIWTSAHIYINEDEASAPTNTIDTNRLFEGDTLPLSVSLTVEAGRRVS
ncbi:hypothetical protein MPER_08132 [Moniliophthora perniciosa FA553]|nr:hypothetical protein MPER_08132 [Moniliophthora perniciosa FA553]